MAGEIGVQENVPFCHVTVAERRYTKLIVFNPFEPKA